MIKGTLSDNEIKGTLSDNEIKGTLSEPNNAFWLNYLINKSIFYSDGIINDNKLNNIKGDQDMAPSLIESNCLDMAIDDTVDFDDLSGWSIISSEGTSEIEINGNSVKCTSAGILYNLILNDGGENHYYPLAEGYHTIAYDTSESPSHGTINCVGDEWTTQDVYHKNIGGCNYRDGLDAIRENDLVDAGGGLPNGFYFKFATPDATTIGGVTRITVPTGGFTSYYKHNVYIDGIENGKDYRATVLIRGSSNRNAQFRFGSVIEAFALTTEWQTIGSDANTADNTYFGIIGYASGNPVEGEWFEFSYLLVEETLDDFRYIPKRENSDLDAEGNSISVLGNGYFIECETKLQFPDNDIYQSLDNDIRMEFVYDKNGDLRKLKYCDLYENVHNLDRAFCQKTDGRITRLILVNHDNFTRDQFILFLNAMGRCPYVYTRITKGAFISCEFKTFDDTLILMAEILNARGVSCVTNFGENEPEAGGTAILEFVSNGNHLLGRIHKTYGAMSFIFLDGEEELFADEIINGDLIVVDSPDGRAAIVYNDWPDFTAIGVLTEVVKTNGTVEIGDYELSGYSNMFWIPAGQSGVPAELEEIPLYRGADGARYYQWRADNYFSVTFTNSDNINVYVIPYRSYDYFSIAGLTCVFKHIRNLFENVDYRYRISMYLESHGMMTSADLMGPAAFEAGLLAVSNGQSLHLQGSAIFDHQNNPDEWAAYFGHHYFLDKGAENLDDVLNMIETYSANNELCDSEFEATWGVDYDIDNFQMLLDKCDEVGMLFLSPIDLIKNMQFNDYDADDFFKGE